MIVRSSLGIAVAVALAAVPAGCKGKPSGDPTKVTTASKADATKPLVDENYRFEIAWPGLGWKLSIV